MNQKVDIQKIKSDAENLFDQGHYFCSEAIVASIRDNMDPSMPEALIAAASGFPIGVGRAKCMCGAVTGAVMCLGYFFGRTEPTTPDDPKSVNTLKLAYEIQNDFRQNHNGVLCCSVHTRGMDMASKERKDQCVAFTGEMAARAAEIIARELNYKVVDLVEVQDEAI